MIYSEEQHINNLTSNIEARLKRASCNVSAHLSLYGAPRIPQAGVVVRVVQHQPFFQVPSGIFTHLCRRRQRGGLWDMQAHSAKAGVDH